MHILLHSTILARLNRKYYVHGTILLYSPQNEGQFYERKLRLEYFQNIKIILYRQKIICLEG